MLQERSSEYSTSENTRELINKTFAELELSGKVNNTSLVAKGVLAHRLQRRTACKIQNGRQGAPKWPTGSGLVYPKVFGRSKQLSQNKFFDSSTPSMRKGRDGGKENGKKKKKWRK